MIVVDASAAIDLLLGADAAVAVAERLARESPDVCAPHLLDAEVGQVLRRHVLRGDLSAARARAALDDLADLPVIRYPHVPLLRHAFRLLRNTTFHDALYLSLAEALGATLLTRDRARTRVPGHRARVELVGG